MKSPHYLEKLLCHPKAADLLHLFPNTKEITESFGAWNAISTHLPHLDRANPDVVALVIGDGHSPRTGALLAMSTAWEVHSIDPLLRQKHVGKIKRLHVHRAEFPSSRVMSFEGRRVLAVAVHSHARLEPILDIKCWYLDAVAIPCCVPQGVGVPPTKLYHDKRIWSPERTVHVWKGLK